MTKPSGPTSLRPMASATMELLPCAMLANGPACTWGSQAVIVSHCVGAKLTLMSPHLSSDDWIAPPRGVHCCLNSTANDHA